MALKNKEYITFYVTLNIIIYYMAELVSAKKKLSDWFPEQSEFSYTDR